MPTLSSGPARAEIDVEDGCRVVSLSFADGLELIGRDGDAAPTSPFHHGAFPMAPFAGRIRHGRFSFAGRTHQLPINFEDHAIHGTVCDRRWAPAGSEHEWRCDLGAPDRWPFAGYALQRVILTDDMLRFELEVHATDQPMPATIGWHPWFRRHVGGASAIVAFDAAQQYRKDDDGIPDGTTSAPVGDEPLDDCFTGLRSTPSITWPGVGTVEVASDTSYLVVYTTPASAVCVEPQTGPPDAPNLGLARIVEPGAPLTAWMELRWRPAPPGTAGTVRGGGRSRTV
ncbi:MAG TPA: hypothetical protein VM143_00490 [Acidimicrobiales bacterium]|nr:hypothetical protein [Acidimicrobiales bacterium]